MFDATVIDVSQRKSIKCEDQPIVTILNQLLEDTKIVYEISDRQIVLTSKQESSVGQQKAVSGKVSDSSGAPLPGVTVVVKETTNGTVTNASGEYALANVSGEAILQFSFIGMRTQEVIVGTQTQIDVVMEEESIGIEEVVAIGYGTVRKSDLTGSVGSVNGDEIASVPTANAMQSLAGRTPGVYVMQNAGGPGADMQVQIRGSNSIQGSNEPLYVVDGFLFTGSLNMINSNDIESIEILKDASATAIYGSRGANGVVLITTKRGKSGETRIDFESSFGVQKLRKKLELMDAEEYANFYNEQATNDGLEPYFSQDEIDGFGAGYDWQDLIFVTAPVYNSTLTVSGGNEKTKFSISGSIMDQKGIIQETYFKRYSLRANLNHEINKLLSVEYSSILTKNLRDSESSQGGNRGGTLLSAAIAAPPTLTPYNEDGTYRLLATGHSFLSGALFNPINYLNEEYNKSDENSVLANLALVIEPIIGLKVRIQGGLKNTEDRDDSYRTLNFTNSQGVANVSVSNNLSLLNENTISYNKTINKIHNISAVAGFTYQDFTYKSLGGSGSGFLSDALETYDLGAAGNPGVPSSGYSKSVILSYLGRLNYSFNNKYLLTASIRTDGASKYSDGHKWGYFPSAAFAWKLKQEPFLKDNNLIDDFKLRTSWGVTGSQAINAYQTLTQLSSGITVFGDDQYTTFAPGTQLPGDLKWESTEQFNLGLDIALHNYRYRLTADFYLKNTHDLLNPVSLPSSLGYSTTIKNVGQIRNNGIEFSLDSKILTGKFIWNLNANLAINRSKVIKLYDGQDILTGSFSHPLITDNAKLIREGEPLGVFYGYLTDGYDETGVEKYKDLEEDGVINELDKTIIGDPNPDFIYGFNSNMKYKNFELNLFIQGSYGNDILNVSGISRIDYQGGLNLPKEVYYNHWTVDNTDAKYPKISTNSTAKYSNRQIEDGSYLRFKNIQLTYNLPLHRWNFYGLDKVQIYFSGQNLITFTKYSWYDPEINSGGEQGLDHYRYPTAKTYSMGIKVSF
ncbi:SusC/RagA family TonB-linked outer membrane protein [Maribellus comscasis]|uniref:SusC/RagA family TonB-linked outer membrane protein n=2 Tax=Maribellus comscasis TaxID=2681766 RepID=A0A6I6K6M4_9BACT|nr:SusC/RagA family TonB-linked outer membrane protein [Maribellus comscasis]